MPNSTDLLLGLLERGELAFVTQEDLDGPHGLAIRAWQEAGFVSVEAGVHPTPSCPHCGEGVPLRVAGTFVCDSCHSLVDSRHLLAWRFDTRAFLGWLSGRLGLSGGVRPVGSMLWQLGTFDAAGDPCECFFARAAPLSHDEWRRLDAHHCVTLLHGARPPDAELRPGLRLLPLPRVLVWQDERLSTRRLEDDPGRGAVCFDPESGALWAGARKLGEVSVGSNECHLLERLAASIDRYVGYAELRREVLRRGGGRDTRDEATFCHELKRRIKRIIPGIDSVIGTNNKGAGYRLRACVGGTS